MSNKDLNIIRTLKESADKEEFKRPNHNDFKTSYELQKEQFSGVRHNSIANKMECWINGMVAFEVEDAILAIDPDAFDRKYKEFFDFKEMEVIRHNS